MNTYTVNYGETVLGYDPIQLLTATTIGGLLQLVTIPLFGWWATKIGSAAWCAIGAVGTLIIAFPIYFLLQSATFPILIGMMLIGGILPTLSWAALGGLMHDLFDSRIRVHGAFVLVRDRGDDQWVHPQRHARARSGDRQRVVAPGCRARGALGHHAGGGHRGLADARTRGAARDREGGGAAVGLVSRWSSLAGGLAGLDRAVSSQSTRVVRHAGDHYSDDRERRHPPSASSPRATMRRRRSSMRRRRTAPPRRWSRSARTAR